MANSNVTDVSRLSQFKDYVSARERLLICDIKHSQIKTNQFVKKQGDLLGRARLFGSKTALA